MSDEEWRALRAGLAAETRAWIEVLTDGREWDESSLTVAVSSVVHLAYHIGAIRQLDRRVAGPPAPD